MSYSKNIEKYNLIFNILERNDNINYIKKNISKISLLKKKYIFIEYVFIDFLLLKKKYIFSNSKLNKTNLFIFYTNKKYNKKYDYSFIPLFPMLLKKDNHLLFIITPMQLEIMDLFNSKQFEKEFYFKSQHYYNAIISNVLITNDNFKNFSIQLIENKINDINNFNLNYLKKHKQGWLSEYTKENIKYVINEFKPKVMVELGSWLGLSTKYIKSLDKDISLYCFDKFQNVLHTSYEFNKYNPLDNFYFNIPRIETFYKNMEDYDNLYTVIGDIDINKILLLFRQKNINVDVFFIDFEKKTFFLNLIINNILKEFPEAIIIGDDLVFDSVKKSIYLQMTQNKRYYGISEESYILSNKMLKNYEHVFHKNIFKKNKNKKILNNVILQIQKNNIYINDNKKYHKKFILKTLEYGKFELFLQFCKYFRIDLNSFDIFKVQTPYHILCKYLRIFNKKKILFKFYEYQKIEPKKDQFLLEPKDYLNYDISIS